MDRQNQHEFIVSSVNRNIQYYEEMVQHNTNPEQKKYFAKLLNREKMWMDYLKAEYRQSENGASGIQTNTKVSNSIEQNVSQPNTNITSPNITNSNTIEPTKTGPSITEPNITEPNLTDPNQRVFTLEELKQNDGSNGKPAYVAVNGIVYDVSLQPTWGGGSHFAVSAGKDLTLEFSRCHAGVVTPLNRLVQVGVMASDNGNEIP